jgi:recombination protein RecA
MVIFINQIRMKIGVMFGSPETTTGGNALKFYSSVRLDIRRIGAIKDRDEVVGNATRVKVVKNKVGDQRIGQGRENAKTFLRENGDIAFEIEDKIRAAHGLDFDLDAGPNKEDDMIEA